MPGLFVSALLLAFLMIASFWLISALSVLMSAWSFNLHMSSLLILFQGMICSFLLLHL
ncbi:hypothetical protein [Corynebacterium phage LGCM-V4]|nr:hypothetical protein [Corynebacterium phage LGCM-V4]